MGEGEREEVGEGTTEAVTEEEMVKQQEKAEPSCQLQQDVRRGF